jgi:hypothetical protein
MEFTVDTTIFVYVIELLTGLVITLLAYLFKSSLNTVKEDSMKLESKIKEVDECVRMNEKEKSNLYVRQDVFKTNNEMFLNMFDNIDKSINKVSSQMADLQSTILDVIKNRRV